MKRPAPDRGGFEPTRHRPEPAQGKPSRQQIRMKKAWRRSQGRGR